MVHIAVKNIKNTKQFLITTIYGSSETYLHGIIHNHT